MTTRLGVDSRGLGSRLLRAGARASSTRRCCTTVKRLLPGDPYLLPRPIPPAFGLGRVKPRTWTGFGSVPYWNAYVATTQMRGQGTFFDWRLNDPERFIPWLWLPGDGTGAPRSTW